MALASAKLPTWYRVLAVIVGVLSVVLAVIVLVAPYFAVWLLIFLLAFGLLFLGMDRMVAGISGQPFWWAQPLMPPTSSQPVPPASTTTATPKT